MSWAPMLRNTLKVVAPFLYVAGIAPVLIGIISVATFVDFSVGLWNDKPGFQLADLSTLRYTGDVLMVTTLFLLGGAMFGSLALTLSRFERLEPPTASDHLRHCILLYTLLCSFVYLLTVSYESQAAGGDMSSGYVLWFWALPSLATLSLSTR